jgi:hypothetical protein
MNGFPLGTRASMYKAHETIPHTDNTRTLKKEEEKKVV